MAGNIGHQVVNSVEVDKALAEFFFGCNIPFVIVESPLFKNFILKLNSTYKPPTRKTLSNNILNQIYDAHVNSVRKVESKDAVLLLDGWKNSSSNKQYVVGLLKVNDGRHVFLDSWNFSTVRETGQALTNVVNECRVMARVKFNMDIYAVVTDNASNMVSMGRQLNIWHATCNSHSGNLLCKSVVNSNLATRVNKVLKEFKSPRLESQVLALRGRRMILISDTRWCSHRDVLRRYLENLNYMRQVVEEDRDNRIKDEIREVLFDREFEAQVQDQILILDPICEFINTCQKLDCSIAKATEKWLQLEIPAINPAYDRLVEERIKKAISVYGLAANYLHPVYQGRRFLEIVEYMNKMRDFFHTHLSQNGLQELEHYQNKTNVFADLFRQNYTSPNTFWELSQFFFQN